MIPQAVPLIENKNGWCCKTLRMYAEYLGRIGQDVLPKGEGLIEWRCKIFKQKGPR
jgi:hypothetical protein